MKIAYDNCIKSTLGITRDHKVKDRLLFFISRARLLNFGRTMGRLIGHITFDQGFEIRIEIDGRASQNSWRLLMSKKEKLKYGKKGCHGRLNSNKNNLAAFHQLGKSSKAKTPSKQSMLIVIL